MIATLALLLAAQFPPPIAFVADKHVSADTPRETHAEQVMAIDPRNPKNMVAASFVIEGSRLDDVVYYSKDGGNRWKRAHFNFPGGDRFTDSLDPFLTAAPDGTIYFIAEDDTFGFWLMRTRDGGATWSTPRYHRYIFDYDRSWGAVLQGPFAGRLYIQAYGAIFQDAHAAALHCGVVAGSYSDDLGDSFFAPRVFSTQARGCLMGPESVVAPADGSLFTFSNVYPRDGTNKGAFYMYGSFDGGFWFDGPVQIATYHSDPNPMNGYDPTEFGAAVDESHDAYRGRIYGIFPDYNGSRYVIKVMHTTSDWHHWSKPIVVNDGLRGSDAIPAIAVNGRGVVAAVWTDKRNAPSDHCYQLAAAVSFDGGQTFSKNVVHAGLTCTSTQKNYTTAVMLQAFRPTGQLGLLFMTSLGGKFDIGGDTNGLTANPDGSFNVVWSNESAGVQQLWYSRFVASGTLGAHGPMHAIGTEAPTVRAQIPAPPKPSVQRAVSMVDLGMGFNLIIEAAHFDSISRIMSVTATLQNEVSAPIRGPFELVEQSPATYPAKQALRALNADNALAQTGAAWKFRVPEPGRTLRSGARTASRVLRWYIPPVFVGSMTFSVRRTRS